MGLDDFEGPFQRKALYGSMVTTERWQDTEALRGKWDKRPPPSAKTPVAG